MKYYIVNIKPGTNSSLGDRRDWIYAQLKDERGSLVIMATLNFILTAIKERNYQVENLLDTLIEVEKLYSSHRKLFE